MIYEPLRFFVRIMNVKWIYQVFFVIWFSLICQVCKAQHQEEKEIFNEVLIEITISDYEPEQIWFEYTLYDNRKVVFHSEQVTGDQSIIRVRTEGPVLGKLYIDKAGIELFIWPEYSVKVNVAVRGWGDFIKQAQFQGELKQMQEVLYRSRSYFYPAGNIKLEEQSKPFSYRTPLRTTTSASFRPDLPFNENTPEEPTAYFTNLMTQRYQLLDWIDEIRHKTPETPLDAIQFPEWLDEALKVIHDFPYLPESRLLYHSVSMLTYRMENSGNACISLYDPDPEVMEEKVITHLNNRFNKYKTGTILTNYEYLNVRSCMELVSQPEALKIFNDHLIQLLTKPDALNSNFYWEGIYQSNDIEYLPQAGNRYLALLCYDKTTPLDNVVRVIETIHLPGLTIGTLSLDYIKSNWESRLGKLPDTFLNLWAEKGIGNKLAIGLKLYEYPRMVILDMHKMKIVHDHFPWSALEEYWLYIHSLTD